MKKTSRKESRTPDNNETFRERLNDIRYRLPFVAVAAWAGAVVLSAILTLAVRVDAASLSYLLASALVLAGTWFLGKPVFLGMKAPSFLPFRKYLGYMAVVLYSVHAIPRLTWRGSGRIGEGAALYLFLIEIVLVALAVFVFFSMRGLKTLAYWGIVSTKEITDKELRKKNASKKKMSLPGKIFDWIDAFLFAAIAVIVIQTFVFQIYEVPTESMVPTFLGKDRPFTVKFLSGPAFPFSEYKLPVLKHPSRGDVVVIRNPRYDANRDLLKQQASRFVFMLTFSLVNPDAYDENGVQKSDPLVKRVIGLPGEKIMMRDDAVFVKRKGDADFSPLEIDATRYSQTDLYNEPADVRNRIKSLPLDAATAKILKKWDEKKNGTPEAYFENRLPELLGELETGIAHLRPGDLKRFDEELVARVYKNPADERAKALADTLKRTGNRFADLGVYGKEPLHFRDIVSDDRAFSDLRAYALSWIGRQADGSTIARDRRIVNLFFKENLLKLFVRDIQLLAAGVSAEEFAKDAVREQILRETQELSGYAFLFFDMRNFGEFPSGDGNYIPEGFYFPMGDNRYNSLDFRNTVETVWKPFDASDPASIVYESNLEPHLLPEANIEGYAVWRVWPLSHFGLVK